MGVCAFCVQGFVAYCSELFSAHGCLACWCLISEGRDHGSENVLSGCWVR